MEAVVTLRCQSMRPNTTRLGEARLPVPLPKERGGPTVRHPGARARPRSRKAACSAVISIALSAFCCSSASQRSILVPSLRLGERCEKTGRDLPPSIVQDSVQLDVSAGVPFYGSEPIGGRPTL